MKLKQIQDKEPGQVAVNGVTQKAASGSGSSNENNTEREDEEE